MRLTAKLRLLSITDYIFFTLDHVEGRSVEEKYIIQDKHEGGNDSSEVWSRNNRVISGGREIASGIKAQWE